MLQCVTKQMLWLISSWLNAPYLSHTLFFAAVLCSPTTNNHSIAHAGCEQWTLAKWSQCDHAHARCPHTSIQLNYSAVNRCHLIDENNFLWQFRMVVLVVVLCSDEWECAYILAHYFRFRVDICSYFHLSPHLLQLIDRVSIQLHSNASIRHQGKQSSLVFSTIQFISLINLFIKYFLSSFFVTHSNTHFSHGQTQWNACSKKWTWRCIGCN